MKSLKKSQYRLLFIDIDGTIVHNLRPIPNKVKQTIKFLKKFFKIIAITGRSTYSTMSVYQELGLQSYAITEGGARIVNPEKNTIWVKFIPYKYVLPIINIFAKANIRFNICLEGRSHYPPFARNIDYSRLTRICALDMKDELTLSVENRLKYIQGVNAFKVRNNTNLLHWNLDITHKNANKKMAFHTILSILGESVNNTIAIGDGLNDLDFVREANLKIVMENGVKELKDIADYIIPPVQENGFASVVSIFEKLEENVLLD